MKAKTPFIIGISGSPHKDGGVVKLINRVLKGAEEEGAETRLIHLYDLNIGWEPGTYSMDPEKATTGNMPDDDMKKLLPLIEKADGLVLGTPVYWANMSGVMKNFIDRLTPLENDGFRLQGKFAAFIAHSKENEGGCEMAAMNMANALLQMGVIILPTSILWSPGHWKNADGGYKNWAEEDAPYTGRNMVRVTRLLQKNPITWDE